MSFRRINVLKICRVVLPSVVWLFAALLPCSAELIAEQG